MLGLSVAPSVCLETLISTELVVGMEAAQMGMTRQDYENSGGTSGFASMDVRMQSPFHAVCGCKPKAYGRKRPSTVVSLSTHRNIVKEVPSLLICQGGG